MTLPDGGNYSDVLLVKGKMTTIQGPHSILGVTLTLEEYFEQFWLGDYPLPIMENYYVISTSPTGTKKLEFKRTLFLSKSSMNTETKDQLGIDFYPNPTNSIVYFGSKQERPMIETEIVVNKISHTILIGFSNRSKLTYDMLIGRNLLELGFIVDVTK